MQDKQYLLIPGPTPVLPRVFAAKQQTKYWKNNVHN